MARWFSSLMRVRGGFKSGSLYLIVALVVFGAVVFFLFRDRSSSPQGAVAGDLPRAPADSGNAGESAPPLAVATTPGPVTPFAPDPTPGSATVQLPSGAADPQSRQVDAAITEAVAKARFQPGEVIDARNKLNKLLQTSVTPEQRRTIKDAMAEMSEDWLFGPAVFAGDMLCDTYTVKRGDLLEIIGRRLKVPYEVLMQINSISRPQALQAGRALKVVHGPFHAKVYRSTFTMDLYLQDMYVRSFKVGLGAPGSETPTGLWRVKEGGKLVQPPWYDKRTNRTYKATDPDYPLGSRWIALDGVEGNAKGQIGFAIHGTKDPNQIGTAASQGCIRMFNGDVVLMYNLLFPLYSQVEVLD